MSLETLVTTMLKLRDLPSHEVLGVSDQADARSIDQSYATLASRYHPGKAADDPVLADAYKEILSVIRKAYETLSTQSLA